MGLEKPSPLRVPKPQLHRPGSARQKLISLISLIAFGFFSWGVVAWAVYLLTCMNTWGVSSVSKC